MTKHTIDKTALITGASSGFGRLVTEGLSARGFRVLAVSRTPEALPKGEGIIAVGLDVAAPETAEALKSLVDEHFGGRLGMLINNAGYGQAGPIAGVSDAEIAAQFEVNLFAVIRLIRELSAALRGGKVINLSSVLGYTGMPYQSLYAASKFAIEGLSESLYYEMKAQGTDVHLIEPGAFRTKFADNVQWVSSESDAGYSGLRTTFQRMTTRPIKAGGPHDPQRVADRIIALCLKRSGKLRHRVGMDAQALYYLRRLLPQALMDRVLGLAYQKVGRSK